MPSCISLSAVLGFVAAAAALSNLQASSPTPDQNMTVTWSSDSSDKSPVTLALFSADSNVTYPGGLALAVVQNPQDNKVVVQFPQVVPGSYMLSFISATNTSDVLASSPAFSVPARAASPSSAATATATAPPSGSASTATPASASRSEPASGLPASAASRSASASSARSSIASAASGAISSVSAAESSGLASVASGAASAAASGAASGPSASGPASSSTGAGTPVRLLGPGAGPALAAALACVALGALVL